MHESFLADRFTRIELHLTPYQKEHLNNQRLTDILSVPWRPCERCFSLIISNPADRANIRRDNALTRCDLFAYTPHCPPGG